MRSSASIPPFARTPRYGFIDVNGSFTQTNLPPGTSTTDNGINNAGVIVGSSYQHTITSVTPNVTPVYTGFIDSGGNITYLNAPGTLTSSGGTYANGINDAGQVVGEYATTWAVNQHGYLYQDNTYTTIDDPNAGSAGTIAEGINNLGAIVGFYYDSSNKVHGFIDIGGAFTTIDNPLGTNGTQLTGINDAGQIVGVYTDSGNVTHGFVASLNGVTTNEDVALNLTSLSVSAADAGSNSIQVTLAVSHGALTLGAEAGVTETGLGTADVTLTGSQSAIDAALANGVTYAPTLNYHFADVLAVTVNDEGHNVTGVAQTTTQDVGIVIAPAHTIAENGTYTVTSASADTIAFAGADGTLVLNSPSTFTGHIADITTPGDVIDLNGFATTDTAATGAGSFNSTTDTTLLTVSDSSHTPLETFTLAGDYSGSTWTVTSDNNGGIDIVDPPATGSAGEFLGDGRWRQRYRQLCRSKYYGCVQRELHAGGLRLCRQLLARPGDGEQWHRIGPIRLHSRSDQPGAGPDPDSIL